MKKAIMISVQPRYVADILSGKKTIEIRKKRPACDLPINVYIYCTQKKEPNYVTGKEGKVVAKFTLRKIEEIERELLTDQWGDTYSAFCTKSSPRGVYREAQLSFWDLVAYTDNKDGYAWYIEDLVIFDEPKELGEFAKWGFSEYYYSNHDKESYITWERACEAYHFKTETGYYRAPQSWCFIEEEEE